MWSDSGRLQWFLDSPILLGTLLSAFMPWSLILLCDGEHLRRLRVVLAVVLASLLVGACALTQSRGPLISVVAASVAGCFVYRRFVWANLVLISLIWIGGLALALPFLLNAETRFSPAVLGEDGSVQNRVVIWKACLDMLSQNPVSGLGSGEAGYFFSQWYQPDKLNYLYAGVFNEYLQLGIERGVIVLYITGGLLLFTFLFPLGVQNAGGCASPGLRFLNAMALSAYLSLLVLGTAGLFSVTSGSPHVRSLAGLDLAVLAWWAAIRWAGGGVRCKTPFFGALLVVSVCAAVLFGVHRSQPNEALTVVRGPGEKVRLRKTEASHNEARVATVLVDRSVLGTLYGKEIRRWLLASGRFDEFLVLDPRYPLAAEVLNENPTVILAGRTTRFLHQLQPEKVREVILVHPILTKETEPLTIPVTVYRPKASEQGTSDKIWSVNQIEKYTKAEGDSLVGVEIKL